MLEIITLTPKGESISNSVMNPSNDWKSIYGYKTLHFVKRLGGRTTFDKICFFIFGNNSVNARTVVNFLKHRGYVIGE